jgi:hypothetical protein
LGTRSLSDLRPLIDKLIQNLALNTYLIGFSINSGIFGRKNCHQSAHSPAMAFNPHRFSPPKLLGLNRTLKSDGLLRGFNSQSPGPDGSRRGQNLWCTPALIPSWFPPQSPPPDFRRARECVPIPQRREGKRYRRIAGREA